VRIQKILFIGERSPELLLDTHVVLWWLWNRRFSGEAMAAISEPSNDVIVSAAAFWEIAIKRALGKLDVPDDIEAQLARNDFGTLPISVPHAMSAGALPRHHADPFDRMLIGQAMMEGLTVVTRDPRFGLYEVSLLPA